MGKRATVQQEPTSSAVDERASIAGLDLRLRRAQRPRAPLLVLTNAWPQTIRCWDRQWDALARRYALLAVDLPGFGLSSGTRETMRPTAQADVLKSLIDRFADHDGRRPILVAPDVGVPVALALAERHRGSVAGLVLFDGPSDYPPQVSWEGRLLYRSALARRVASILGMPFALECIRRGYRNRAQRPSREAVREYVRVASSPYRFALTLQFLASYAEELPAIARALGEIDVPVLVTWGVHDPFLAPSNGERLARGIPGAVWRPLDGASHYAHEDAGDRFLQMLDDWIAERVRPDRSTD